MEAGTVLAHYRVLGPLGAGGMGEVYRAHDTRLERTVALKILPPSMLRNDERRRRFVQEAKSASSLNHPHLITIHEIGEAEPSSSDGQAAGEPLHYIAMELIDGSTLNRKIHSENIDLRQLLGYLGQAADGLAKAHAAGIIHRDLKPDNIMVTRDGFAKVLDFGLAKLGAAFSATDSTIESPRPDDRTREGTLLGTVAYMSPEQVQGKEVDHRSDIFSFGAILYEAATRRRPFSADSDIELMHKILHDKPQPVEELNESVPVEVRRMIRRCMAKDPERRYQSMKDLAIELRELADEYDELSTSSSRASSTSAPPSLVPVARRRGWWLAAAALVMLVILGGAAFFWSGRQAPAATPAPFASMSMQQLTFSGNAQNSALSADGRYLAYVGVDNEGLSSLNVRQVATGSEVRVAEAARELFAGVTFSPDGNYLFYARREPDAGSLFSWLFQVPALGGPSRKLIYDVDTRVSFSPDGKQFVFTRGVPNRGENHIIVANADGSGERRIASFARYDPVLPAAAWSPDGKTIAASIQMPPSGRYFKVVLIDVADGTQRDAGTARWWWMEDVAWQPDGKSLLLAAMHDEKGGGLQVWRQPYPTGEPVRLTNDLNDYISLSVSGDGRALAAIKMNFTGELYVAEPSDAGGGRRVDGEASRRINTVKTSASGAMVYEIHGDRSINVRIMAQPGATPRTLTQDAIDLEPAITADGRTVVYTTYPESGVSHVHAVDADGSRIRPLTQGKGEVLHDISPDGTTLLYATDDGLWKMPVAGGAPVKVIDRTRSRATISPDSRYAVFTYYIDSDSAARVHLRVVPLAGGEPVLDIPWRRDGREFRWLPDASGVTYAASDGAADNLFVQPLDGSEPRQLTKFTAGRITSHTWRADGRVVMVRGEAPADVVLIKF